MGLVNVTIKYKCCIEQGLGGSEGHDYWTLHPECLTSLIKLHQRYNKLPAFKAQSV